jgi:hypothetical protein
MNIAWNLLANWWGPGEEERAIIHGGREKARNFEKNEAFDP